MIRKMNLMELIKLLEGYKRDDYLIKRFDQIFKPHNFYKFFGSMISIANEIEDFTLIVYLTRRRSLIVILQENYYELDSYSKANIDIDEIEKLAKKRFMFTNRDKSKFNHPEVIHPKNPFKFYGDDLKSLNHYRDSLEILLEYPKIYIFNNDAITHLHEFYDRIKN